jgi:hypothetical protein
VGLAGESRSFDSKGQWFRVALNGAQYATPFGHNRFLLSDRPILGANPPNPGRRSPLRPDVPCETQQTPDLRTNPAPPPAPSFKMREAPAAAQAAAMERAIKWLRSEYRRQGRDDVKVVDDLFDVADLSKLPKVPQVPKVVQGGGK